MARVRHQPEPERPPALIASARAVKIDSTNGASVTIKGEGWQKLVWRYYNTVGEFRAACNWVGNVLSRATLYATYDDGSGPKPVEEGTPAYKALDELFGGRQGQTQMLHDLGVFYSAPGEAHLVAWPEKKKGKETWQWGVYDSSEIEHSAGVWKVGGQRLDKQPPWMIRTWRAHPAKKNSADSPARAALPVLTEVERTTAHIAAQLTSRLSSAGILLLPNEMAVTTVTEETDDGQQTTISAAQVVERLSAVARRALADPSDPAALVPIVLTADGEHLDKPRLLEFWTDLDASVQEMRDNAVKRLALAMDMPPEVLTGLGDTSHWGAWQVDESAVKSHTEPLLSQITFDLTQGFLIPALTGVVDDPENYGIAADTTGMRLRPNRSQEAIELFDRGALSAAALLRETGFDPADAMGDEERKIWLLMKAASGSTTPEIVVEAMRLLGAPLPEPVLLEAEPTEAPSVPSLKEHPAQDPPEQDAALVAAADQMVWRALERSGNRLASKFAGGRKPRGVDSASVYLFTTLDDEMIGDALSDAWTTCDRTAQRMGLQPGRLEETLDQYVRGLMAHGQQHTYELLAAHLGKATLR